MTYIESTYDQHGFEEALPTDQCEAEGQYPDIAHGGSVYTRYSRSGMTSSRRCDAHQSHHDDILDGIDRRYPDSDFAPSWFDPTYAGESWNGDY